MARLLIGSYILDSADSSSTSSTSGVTFELEGDDPLRPIINEGEYAWPVMYAHVTAATEAALKTATDTVIDTIRNCAGSQIIYEETSGTTLFEMHPNIWPDAVAEVAPDYSQLECDIAFSIIGRQPQAVISGGAGDEPGQRSMNWQYEVTAGGVGGMVCTAEFGPTLSGTTVTAGARENVVAFVNKMSNTANYPSWLDANFRLLSSVTDFDQKNNQTSVAESSYDPAVVVLTFRELDATLAAASSWPAQGLGATWSVNMEPRDPINVRGQQFDPGFDFELVGSVQLKTEGNTTWNSSETKLTDAQIIGNLTNAVSEIITQFKAVYSTYVMIQLGDPRLDIDALGGFCGFAVTFTSSVGILEWEETGELRNVWPKIYSRASDGSDLRYANEGGAIKVLQHELRIVKLDSPAPYKPPILGSGWDEQEIGATPTLKRQFAGNGQTVYTTKGDSFWRYIQKSPKTVNPDKKTSPATHPEWGQIGSGDI